MAEIVAGLPLTMSGEKGPQAEKALEYIEQLKDRVSVDIVTWDERLSTTAANRALIESDMRRSKRKGVVDKVAATLILQGYLDAKRAR